MAPCISAEYLAELFHAAVQIDPYGAVRQSGAIRYFRTGHTLDKPQDQCLAIRVGEGPDRVEDCGRLDFVFGMSGSTAEILVPRVVYVIGVILDGILWHGMPVVVVRQIPSDRRRRPPKLSTSRSVESRRSAFKKTS